eukprot:5672728-Amphidinium_carterae.1
MEEVLSDSSTDIDAAEPSEEVATELMRHKLYGTVHRLQDRSEYTFMCGRASSDLYVSIELHELVSAKCCKKCFP